MADEHANPQNCEDSCKLWMGDLSPYMDEVFIRSAFRSHSFELVAISWVNSHPCEETVHRCYLEFTSADNAKSALENLNHQPIPGNTDGKKFQLNWASKVKDSGGEEHNLTVRNLSAEVDSSELLEFFQTNYTSVISAKVVNNESGTSQGFGLIRFLDGDERDRSIAELDGLMFVGTKPVTMQIVEMPPPQSSGQDAGQRPSPALYAYGGYVYGTETNNVDKNHHEDTNYEHGAVSTALYSYSANYSTDQSDAHETPVDAKQVAHSSSLDAVSSSGAAYNSEATYRGHTQVSLTSLDVSNAELIARDQRLFEAMQEAKWDLQFNRKILGTYASPVDGFRKP